MIRTTGYVCGAAASILFLAACGSGNDAASAPTGAATTGPADQTGGQSAGQSRAPGVSGLIAAVAGSTIQVQTRTEQTAVSWTATTKITDQVATTSSEVKVGDCVSARPATTGAAPSEGAPAGESPTAPPTMPSTIDAATVQIISRGTGSCDIGTQGGRPAGAGADTAPGGQPSPRPTGSGGARGGFAGGAGGFGGFGTVTAVSGTTLTIQESAFAGRPTSGSTTSSPTASPSTRAVTVNFTSTTKFTTSQTASASAIKAGQCVTVQGTPDDTGAVSATALSLSPATDGQCTGFGGRGA